MLCSLFNIIQTRSIIVLTVELSRDTFILQVLSIEARNKIFIVMLLCANDLAVGFILTMQITRSENSTMLFVYVLCARFLQSVSMATFLVLDFEICLFVIHPIFHRVKITNRRVFHVLLVLWILLVVVSYLFSFNVDENTVNVFMTFIFSFVHCKFKRVVLTPRSHFHPFR